MGKRQKTGGSILIALCCIILVAGSVGDHVKAEGFYENSFLTFSPDHGAWTVKEKLPNASDASDRINPSCWYPYGERIETGIASTLEELKAGEHYYGYERKGLVPIQKWVVIHKEGRCIHNAMAPFHELVTTNARCFSSYYSGWNAYCADCGEKVLDFNVYLSREKVEKITAVDTTLDYYYLCPTCGHMEQGCSVHHKCKGISANRYRVQYLQNGGNVAGFMQSSFHMYGNAEWFEGEPVTPARFLNKNSYSRKGYVFVGWNTQADGSGENYGDEQEIWNLTEENYDPETGAGTVCLYAQWKKVNGILEIDPAGGTYLGEAGITTVAVGYDEIYCLKASYVIPPKGFLVKFDVQGGEPLDDRRETKNFYGWKLASPFVGALNVEEYRFLGKEGDRDRICATYASEGILLPLPRKEGLSFGGWYFDETFERFAGREGELLVPEDNLTLHACWVDLALTADLNLSAFHGKGAVDLRWQQKDGNQKVYLLYQRKEGEAFQRLYGGMEEEAVEMPTKEIFQSSALQISQNGFYRLVACGAQGQDYEDWKGGLGGRAEGVFYLEAGDQLSIVIGRQNGENGGGSGNEFGNGGGRSEIISQRHGTLLAAGGGGGASSEGDGGDGGSEDGLREDGKWQGESGPMGGGAGWIGGKAGVFQKHVHEQGCIHVHVGDEASGGECYELRTETRTCHVIVSGPNIDYGKSDNCDDCIRAGRGGIGTMHPWCWRVTHVGCGKATDNGYGGWWVCSVCGSEGYSWGCGKRRPSLSDHLWNDTIYVLACTREYDCGDPPGNVVGSHGGSNFVKTDVALSYIVKRGIQEGDGMVIIQPVNVGFQDGLELLGAYAPDLAPPHAIDLEKVSLGASGDGTLEISFEKPKDAGTTYYHQVHSYLAGKEERLSSSNITVTEVVTGVAGYYYLIDDDPNTILREGDLESEMSYCKKEKIEMTLQNPVTYLHVAPVDGAGNMGESVTMEIRLENLGIAWNLATTPVEITPVIEGRDYGSAVRADDQENAYYVRADGRTPFLLSFQGLLLGYAREDYQIDRMKFEFSLSDGIGQGHYTMLIPLGSRSDGAMEQSFSGEMLGGQTGGTGILQAGMYGKAVRTNMEKDLWVSHSFCMDPSFHKKSVLVIPGAGARAGSEIKQSDHEDDLLHGILLIGDGEAPVISGLEEADRILLQRDGDGSLDLKAEDCESGVAEFVVVLRNLDNGGEAVFYPEEDGHVRILLEAENPLFAGDLQLTARAVDRVGNESTIQRGAEDFGLKAEIVRVLSPHEPVFKRGESGILVIKARGYVERIEVDFPESFLRWNAEIDRLFVYETPREQVREEILFMVPLTEVEDREYVFTVRAYKGGGVMEDEPRLCTLKVEDTIFGEIRTRLR